jgi:hypothetical protein
VMTFLAVTVLLLFALLVIAVRELQKAQSRMAAMDWDIRSSRECMSQLLGEMEAAITFHQDFKNKVALYVGHLGEEAMTSASSSLFLGNRLPIALEDPLHRYSEFRIRLAGAMKLRNDEKFDPRFLFPKA